MIQKNHSNEQKVTLTTFISLFVVSQLREPKTCRLKLWCFASTWKIDFINVDLTHKNTILY